MRKTSIVQIPMLRSLNIRQELLLFDKVYVPENLVEMNLMFLEKHNKREVGRQMMADLNYLVQENQVHVLDTKDFVSKTLAEIAKDLKAFLEGYDPVNLDKTVARWSYIQSRWEFIKAFDQNREALRQEVEEGLNSPTDDAVTKLITYNGLGAQYEGLGLETAALLLEISESQETIPVYSDQHRLFLQMQDSDNLELFKTSISDVDSLKQKRPKKETPVSQILLKALPTPSEDTPLADIIEFKSNSENTRKLRLLNRWCQQVNTEHRSEKEIIDEIEFLLEEYRYALNLNSLKYELSTMEVVTTGVLRVLENLVKIKWSDIAKHYFEIKRMDVDYRLSEMKAPGRDLAYLHVAHERFEKGKESH